MWTRDNAAGAIALVQEDRAVTRTDSQTRLAEALLRCMGRWGLAKTTIEDIAREAGVSRATAYRLYPGGKAEILETAACLEVQRLVDEVSVEIERAPDIGSSLVAAVHRSVCFLHEHPALRFMLDHEPVALEQFLDFERVDDVLNVAADMLAPSLQRYFTASDARWVGLWLARIVLSHVQTPSAHLDLTDRSDVEHLVRSFITPGLPSTHTGAEATVDI